jgi:hypothetical protein
MLCPIVGGNWNNSSNAGVWSLNLNNSRSNSAEYYGVRADSISPHTACAESGIKGGAFLRWAQACAKSAGHPFSSRRHVAFERLGVFL